MKGGNTTLLEDFLIVGFADFPELKCPLFVVFLLIYLLTLVGNLLIVAIICMNANLHTPMYFFLANLSFIEICYTSVIFPQMLSSFFLEGAHISLTKCLLQVYFFMVMVSLEFLLLTVMAYDRFVAICHPLRYTTVMNKAVCIQLAATTWIVGFVDSIPHIVVLSGLSFCESHRIDHFFCDVTALMKLSCGSTQTIEMVNYIIGAILPVMTFILIITSYVKIISAILKIHSTEGRRKAFSTCTSHLTVVIVFYVSICSAYLRPTSTYSMKGSKILSLSYTTLTPLCNPIIYSLKNTEFKNALRKKKSTV